MKRLPIGYQLTQEDCRRLLPKILALARDFGFSGDARKDLVQETLLHAQQALNIGKFDGESALDTWIVGIAKHRCLRHWRALGTAKRSAVEVSLETRSDGEPARIDLPIATPDPEELAGDRQLLARTLRALHDLPEKLRTPLVLLAKGNTYREIGAILRLSPDLVTSRLHQARTKLRQAVPRPPRGSPR